MAAAQPSRMLRRCLLLLCLLLYSPTAVLAVPKAADSQDLERAVQVLHNESGGSVPNLLTAEDAAVIRARKFKHGNRKLLQSCTKSDISIFQGQSSPSPSGIPTFTVQIFNLCAVDCPISNVHISCGWFASANLVLPNTFRRVRYNDCLVNDGKPIEAGHSVYFQYSNSFEYALEVKFVQGCQRY